MNKIKKITHIILLFLIIPIRNKFKFISYLKSSNSQLRQDLFALSFLDFKKNGFFIEFGACDGLYFSNTFLLEKTFNWKGILCEPGQIWHENLLNNRNCFIDFQCIWKESNKSITLFESTDPGLSSLYSDANNLNLQNLRTNKSHYSVNTITLKDILLKYNAPKIIDFLSIDTEGSEYEILENFDFQMYKFRIICIEHNYSDSRNAIYKLLTKHGYIRKYPFISRFDDWYILS
jgi:FkbM family methyltransferase